MFYPSRRSPAFRPRETSTERADLHAPTLDDRADDLAADYASDHAQEMAMLATYKLAVRAKHQIALGAGWTERYTYYLRGRNATTTLRSVWEHARDILAEADVGRVRLVLVGDTLRLESAPMPRAESLPDLSDCCDEGIATRDHETLDLNLWGPC